MKKSVLITASVLVCMGACVALVNDDDTSNNKATTQLTDTIASNETAQEISSESIKSDWEYQEEIDEMTDKICYYAYITSENSVDFDFPYQGGSTLRFIIRDSPQYGKDIYIRISSGQFNTNYNGTKIKMRIDENPAITINCTEASDSSTDILCLKGYDKIIKLLKGAKTMKISAEFFSEGTRTFTFNVENLQWTH